MPNEKEIWIRARCSRVLRGRLDRYLALLEQEGKTAKESEVLREALVQFLNRVAPITPSPPAINEPSAIYGEKAKPPRKKQASSSEDAAASRNAQNILAEIERKARRVTRSQ